jgi:hypothetical protein
MLTMPRAAHVAQNGRIEICCEPWVAGLSRELARAARGIVSIGKKTGRRALRGPV